MVADLVVVVAEATEVAMMMTIKDLDLAMDLVQAVGLEIVVAAAVASVAEDLDHHAVVVVDLEGVFPVLLLDY